MPSRNTIEIVIEGKDQASKVLNDVNKSLDTLGKVSLGVIVGGVTTATAAITGFGIKALSEFSTFQKGMAEVFTLLPDISGEAMDKMQSQVQAIAAQFGKLPEEVIPAVYQAISAGVPPDNIFEFMQVASKAAIGGVTDLETAVDGITSVVNAYGSANLSAQKASDLLFTAVRLGKTDFTQLSNSLFNVVPTASSLGIGLDQVTAALATLTAQGTPTSVATTQLRQLFVELSKDGSKLSDQFSKIANKSFGEFIKGGGNVLDALEMLRDSVGGNDDEFRNMFGSVEALNAALGLSGNNADSYANALVAMSDSAGATDKAFKTMSNTLAFQADRVKAKFSNLLINVGRQIEPFAIKIVEGIGDALSVLDDFLSGDMTEGGDFTGFAKILFDALKTVKPVFDELRRLISGFFGALQAGIPFIDTLRVYINAILPPEMLQPFDDFLVLIGQIGNAIGQAIAPIIEWVKNNVELKDVLIVIAGAIATVVVPAIAGLIGAIASFAAPIIAIIGAVALLRQAWESDFGGIRTAVENVVSFLSDKFSELQITIANVIGEISKFVQQNPEFILAMSAITAVIGGIILVGSGLPVLLGLIGSALGIVTGGIAALNIPAIALIGIITGLVFALSKLYPGGIAKLLSDAATAAQQLTFIITFGLNAAATTARQIVVLFIAKLNELITTLQNVKREIDKVFSNISTGASGIAGIAGLLSSGQVNFGDVLRAAGIGAANGLEYAPRDMPIRIHQGEAVLTRQENEARLSGNMGATYNNFSININAPMTQKEADDTTQNMLNALKKKGIELNR